MMIYHDVVKDIAQVPAALAVARRLSGLTQRELAARAGTTQALVARIERGRANPTLNTVTRLFEAAGAQLMFEARPRVAADPLIESYKRDVDRTLLRDNLAKSHDERVATLVAMTSFRDEAERVRARRKLSS